ncbi:unnamed protein product [Hermetia illucens]|uniref:Uncharacterized protein n=1 Tax=Hermetia illucens TaxID=343691 RepID=A0A7R8UCQ2_HERIL|nr:unnamed protein product [Hermetia illucens]
MLAATKILFMTILFISTAKSLPVQAESESIEQATSQEADDLKASEQFYRPHGYNLGFGFGGYPPIRAYPGRFYGRYYGGYPFYYG